MQELALAGAKVLNAQAVEFARDRGIAIHARSTFQSGPGTLVKKSAGRELRISGVAVDVGRSGGARRQSGRAPRGALEARRWPREAWDAAAIVPLENVHGLPGLLDALRSVASVEEGLAQVSVVGTGIGASKDPLDRALRALGSSRGACWSRRCASPPGAAGDRERMRAPAAREFVERS